jgi:hypothetical protein
MQRGRKNQFENIVPLGVNGLPPRLTAPSGLSAAERTLFNELVGSCDPRHFVKSDRPLLVSYVQSTLLSLSSFKQMKGDPDMVTVWEKATRMQATLATRLRLAPQARTDPLTIARQHAAYHAKPAEEDEYEWKGTKKW